MSRQDDLAGRLGLNLRQLRSARGLTQAQIAKLAGIPRATWAHLESGDGNPTLAVLSRAAAALQVTTEELIARPRAAAEHHPASTIQVRTRGGVNVRKLLPDPIPGMEIDRMQLAVGSTMVGTPHTPGTREYLTCEAGQIVLVVSGETYVLEVGDVVAFRGDQRHSYSNRGTKIAIGYSTVLLTSLR
ncbi:MAG: XRE family transcriptional regulator [Polyangiaceae bacterium]